MCLARYSATYQRHWHQRWYQRWYIQVTYHRLYCSSLQTQNYVRRAWGFFRASLPIVLACATPKLEVMFQPPCILLGLSQVLPRPLLYAAHHPCPGGSHVVTKRRNRVAFERRWAVVRQRSLAVYL